jgi:transcriptional regulator with XRE-family HTH domain
MTTFAERLAELRQEAGLSQRVLAGLVGVNRSQISRWETGNGAIDDQKLTRLADAFSKVLGRQISTDFILGREDRAEVASKDPSNNVAAPRVYPMGMTRQVPVFRKINIGEELDLIGQEDVPMSELRDTTASCFFLERRRIRARLSILSGRRIGLWKHLKTALLESGWSPLSAGR